MCAPKCETQSDWTYRCWDNMCEEIICGAGALNSDGFCVPTHVLIPKKSTVHLANGVKLQPKNAFFVKLERPGGFTYPPGYTALEGTSQSLMYYVLPDNIVLDMPVETDIAASTDSHVPQDGADLNLPADTRMVYYVDYGELNDDSLHPDVIFPNDKSSVLRANEQTIHVGNNVVMTNVPLTGPGGKSINADSKITDILKGAGISAMGDPGAIPLKLGDDGIEALEALEEELADQGIDTYQELQSRLDSAGIGSIGQLQTMKNMETVLADAGIKSFGELETILADAGVQHVNELYGNDVNALLGGALGNIGSGQDAQTLINNLTSAGIDNLSDIQALETINNDLLSALQNQTGLQTPPILGKLATVNLDNLGKVASLDQLLQQSGGIAALNDQLAGAGLGELGDIQNIIDINSRLQNMGIDGGIGAVTSVLKDTGLQSLDALPGIKLLEDTLQGNDIGNLGNMKDILSGAGINQLSTLQPVKQLQDSLTSVGLPNLGDFGTLLGESGLSISNINMANVLQGQLAQTPLGSFTGLKNNLTNFGISDITGLMQAQEMQNVFQQAGINSLPDLQGIISSRGIGDLDGLKGELVTMSGLALPTINDAFSGLNINGINGVMELQGVTDVITGAGLGGMGDLSSLVTGGAGLENLVRVDQVGELLDVSGIGDFGTLSNIIDTANISDLGQFADFQAVNDILAGTGLDVGAVGNILQEAGIDNLTDLANMDGALANLADMGLGNFDDLSGLVNDLPFNDIAEMAGLQNVNDLLANAGIGNLGDLQGLLDGAGIADLSKLADMADLQGVLANAGLGDLGDLQGMLADAGMGQIGDILQVDGINDILAGAGIGDIGDLKGILVDAGISQVQDLVGAAGLQDILAGSALGNIGNLADGLKNMGIGQISGLANVDAVNSLVGNVGMEMVSALGSTVMSLFGPSCGKPNPITDAFDPTMVAGREHKETFSYGQTMAWQDDFKAKYDPKGDLCWYWKPDFPGIDVALLPSCRITMSYTEPTVQTEASGQTGPSHLGDLQDFANDNWSTGKSISGLAGAKQTGGVAAAGFNTKTHAFYETRIWGISPQARFDSSASADQAKKSLACDMAHAWSRWVLMNTGPVATPMVKLGVYPIPAVVAELSGWQSQWFGGAPDLGTKTCLGGVYLSEQDRAGWVMGNGDPQDAAFNICPQGDRMVNPATNQITPHEHEQPGCIGGWGSQYPRTGFVPSLGNDAAAQALLGWRAYDRVHATKINKRKVQKGTADGKYWLTDFNLDWPYKTTRMEIGMDAVKWEAERGNHQALSLTDMQGANLGNEPALALKKDGQVMTYWKDTECKVSVCCHRWTPSPKWRAMRKWKIKDVDDIK